jgi:hypothetical protein
LQVVVNCAPQYSRSVYDWPSNKLITRSHIRVSCEEERPTKKLFLRMLVSAALAASASAHADTAPVAADSAKGNDSLLDEIVVAAASGGEQERYSPRSR